MVWGIQKCTLDTLGPFRSSENIERVILEEKKASFLYKNGSSYFFMDSENYEQIEINGEIIGHQKNFLIDAM